MPETEQEKLARVEKERLATLKAEIVNKERGEIAGEIGGLKFILDPTFDNIQKLEIVLGKSLIKMAIDFGNQEINLTFAEAAQIIHLLSKEPIPSLDRVGKAIMKGGFSKALTPITQLLDNVLTGGAAGKAEAKENDTP